MTDDARPAARDGRIGLLAMAAGTMLAFGLQVITPVGVPLYDGVVVQEPYRYLHPSAGQAGDPASFASAPSIEGTVSPAFVAATTESPPQAQLIAQRGAFVLTPGATSLQVSITPVEPPGISPEVRIAGNVYRIVVTDQSGTALSIAPCEGCVTLVMRAPAGTEQGRMMRFAADGWTDVGADHVPTTGVYAWSATTLGDFAIVDGSDGGGLGMDQVVLMAGAAVLMVLLVTAALLFRRGGTRGPTPVRRDAGPDLLAGPRTRGIPAKRKGPRRPPSGRPPSGSPPSGRSDR